MFDRFFAGLPFLFPTLCRNNANTLPVASVNVTADNVVLELPPHAFYGRDYVGGFFIDLRTAIPTGTTATLPVLLGTNGDTRPLVTYGGAAVTVGDLAGTGVYLIHYNRYTNQVFLVSGGFRTAAAAAASTQPLSAETARTKTATAK